MIKLSPQEYPIANPLFHDNYPNLPFIYGVIENRMPGEIWINDTNIASWKVAEHQGMDELIKYEFHIWNKLKQPNIFKNNSL